MMQARLSRSRATLPILSSRSMASRGSGGRTTVSERKSWSRSRTRTSAPICARRPSGCKQKRGARMKIGAHVGSSGGVFNAIDNAVNIGAETIQTFNGAPAMWRRKVYKEGEGETYRAKEAAKGMQAKLFHGLYPGNLGRPTPGASAQAVVAARADKRGGELM